MPTDPPPLTVFAVVRRAVEVCELGTASERLDELLERFEDDDQPISAVPSIVGRVAEVRRELDPFGDDPALAMATAVIAYLAFRRDQVGDEAADLLRLAARSEFDAHPPPPVAQWLDEAGVTV